MGDELKGEAITPRMNVFDGIISDWHRWAQGYKHVGSVGASAMFNQAKSPRGYDSESEIADNSLHNAQMATINFHVFELPSDQCTSIQIYARNLVTGKSVWTSARLPTDPEARAALLSDAKATLLKKLISAGVV